MATTKFSMQNKRKIFTIRFLGFQDSERLFEQLITIRHYCYFSALAFARKPLLQRFVCKLPENNTFNKYKMEITLKRNKYYKKEHIQF
ncbi:MAG: hypothetical protein BGO40_01375 [Chryseobacterium sp. 39-10]|nr:MAG: hypothetical protein BGO40_01375 [Chryseobacterium sp. 39-10]